MATKGLIRQADNVCVNVISDEGDYVPDAGFELQTGDGAAKGRIWNGTGYDPIPDSVFEDAAAKAISGSSPVLATIAEALFQIAKAANTSDWSAFKLKDGTPVTNKVLFNTWLKELYRANSG